MITREQFMVSAGYIAFIDSIGRKCMARYYPHENSLSGHLRIYDFETLTLLHKFVTKDFGAVHFYETVCTDPEKALQFVKPETAQENAEQCS